MKKIGIIPNMSKDNVFNITHELAASIISQACTPIILDKISKEIGFSEYGKSEEEIYRQSDFITVLGGDGTLLGVARVSAMYNTPIMGINLGTLGFLTDCEQSEAKNAISKVLKGEYKLEKRMMLEVSAQGKPKLIGLNDICVTRGAFSRIINIKIYVNDELLNSFPADGIVISTPTGSTAYNLSAGGPILIPSAEMMVITPICPHTLNVRSLVVSGNDKVRVEINEATDSEISMSVDGQINSVIRGNTSINIKKSQYYTTIIKTNDISFYDVLRKKIF